MEFMRAAVYKGTCKIEIETLPIPPCPIGGALVRISYCGICGGDVRSYYNGLKNGIINQVMGHEISGEIVEVSKGITRFSPGDRVALAPDISCGECWYCKHGLVNLCLSHKMLGTNYAGGFAQYIALPADVLLHGFIEHIPDGMSLMHAAFAEPCAGVIACQNNIGVSAGDTVVIIGDGPIGCLHYETAKARGAQCVILVGRGKLELAKRFTPDYLISNYEPERATNDILSITGGLGADIVILAVPNVAAQQQAIHMVRKRGKIVIYGGAPSGREISTLDSNQIHYNELTITGSFSYSSTGLYDALSAISSGFIHVDKYLTRTVSLDNVVLGIEYMRKGQDLKVLIDPWKL